MSSLKIKLTNIENPFIKTVCDHLINYPTPSNLNYSYSFGSLAGLFYFLQIVTGFLLAMHYTPEIDAAFDSVINLTHNISNGWWLRYLHVNGASMIFIMIYLHIGRALYFQSYLGKQATVWRSGIILMLLMMATAFIGYVLPWGQMSLWGATVITNFVTAIPYVGNKVVHWIWGGYSVSGATLSRFYSLHYLLPFVILSIIFSHLILLHQVGSTNPAQTKTYDTIDFHNNFTYKDTFAFTISIFLFIYLVFFKPNLLGHPDNYIPANPLVTPIHIVPEWYFTPFYAILRSCSSKLGGVLSMLFSILILFLLPFNSYFQKSYQELSAKSNLHKIFLGIFCITFLLLIYLGCQPASEPFIKFSQVYTIVYFCYFATIIFSISGVCNHTYYEAKS